MRQTLIALGKRRPRLLASEVLRNVEALQKAPKPIRSSTADKFVVEAAATASKNDTTIGTNPFFQQLPPTLSRFFQRFPPPPFKTYAEVPVATNAEDANPFLPNKHPITGRHSSPKYSLRRQSDLYKEAYRLGITHLLPKLGNSKRLYEDKHENKTPMKGTQMFKLTKGERTKESRIAEVNEALSKADEIIAEHRGRAYRRKVEKKHSQPNPWY